MTNTQEVEQDDIDTTAEKAKAIGKEIGTVEDKGEEIPDYEIQEAPDDDDERIAKEKEPRAGKSEKKPISNREKRELRKKRLSEKFSEKDAEIQRLLEENEQMKRWKQEVDGRLSGISKAEVEKAWNETAAAFTQAEKDHADAFAEGDGAKATRAMRVMYDAQRRIEQLQMAKQQMERQPAQDNRQAQEVQRPDAAIVNKAKSWAEKNAWYNAGGSDIDSEIARTISGVLANEGYDPKTDDYWDELDDRLEERKVGQRESEEDEPVQRVAKKRTSPPVSGGSTRGDLNGKRTVTLPTSYINTLKANGIWDDIPRRNKIIAERERILRESN